MKQFALFISLALSVSFSAFAKGPTDDHIAKAIIQQSIDEYDGACACPFSVMSNGRSCGKRSAYSRPGGESPICFKSDVTKEMIAEWKAENGNAEDEAKPDPEPVIAEPLQAAGPHSLIYNRGDWKHWIDADGDCQDTRAEVLIAASETAVEFKAPAKCEVLKGSWKDPYSDKVWTAASDLDIDHIVPLKWANGHGGSFWSSDRKKEFANDFENLLAVEDRLNQSKSDKGPDVWMPPKHEYRCEYLKRFDRIVAKYSLKYVPQEERVLKKQREACAN